MIKQVTVFQSKSYVLHKGFIQGLKVEQFPIGMTATHPPRPPPPNQATKTVGNVNCERFH